MSSTDSRTISADKVVLIGGLFLLVWLVFAFTTRKPETAPSVAPVAVESKLHAVGLADNVDWEGMPELFAVWSEHAGWKDGKAQFAYWDQGYRSYSYFFEATRVNGKVWFRSLPEPEFIEGSGSSFALIYVSDPETCMVADTDLKTESPEHPFLFFKPMKPQRPGPWIANPRESGHVSTEKPWVKVDVRSMPVDLPKPELKASTPVGR